MGLLLKLVVALQSATLGSQFPLLEGPFLVPFRPLQYFEHCDVLLSHLMQSKYSYFFSLVRVLIAPRFFQTTLFTMCRQSVTYNLATPHAQEVTGRIILR
jgi:hypothetical protein